MTTVLVFVEREDGALTKGSLEALTLARGLAEAEGATLEAATVGAVDEAVAGQLGTYGVTTVSAVLHDLLDDYSPDAYAEGLLQLVAARDPRAVVSPGSDRGAEVMAHVAARADLPLAANCTAVTPADGAWELTRVRWGGVLLEDARLEAARGLFTVAPHQVAAAPAADGGSAAVETFAPDLDEAVTVTRVRDREKEAEGVSLATAPVVVSGGRGVGSAEGFAVLEELAELVGGAVGCSRVATNNGWRSHSDQVGQTGTRVAPDLYIACGISGATQHWVGCMASKRILAINTDAEAPMVTRASHAVIGDVHDVLPAIVAEIRTRRGD